MLAFDKAFIILITLVAWTHS